MRGIYTSVNEIRKQVFAEIAKLSYEYKDGDEMRLEQIPYDTTVKITYNGKARSQKTGREYNDFKVFMDDSSQAPAKDDESVDLNNLDF